MSIITFQRGDRTALTKNFNRSEFQCSCGCGQQSVDTELAEKLQLIRDKVDRPLKITSGYRCITHNAAVGGSQFLSTPSARRATAKTERKHPAFVSLYTSLHKLQRDACKPNRKITPLLAQTAGIPVRSVPEYHVCCRFALAGHQKISTLSWANSGCSPTCSTLVW